MVICVSECISRGTHYKSKKAFAVLFKTYLDLGVIIRRADTGRAGGWGAGGWPDKN